MRDDEFISGDGVKIEATISNIFTVYRAMATPNLRANLIWKRVIGLEEEIKYLDYKAKNERFRSLWIEILNIADYSSPNLTIFYTTYGYLSRDLNLQIERLLEYSKRGPIRLVLNEYDFIPTNFNELTEAQQLLYIMNVKFVANLAVDQLMRTAEKYSLSGWHYGSADCFCCSLSREQLSYLLRTLKRMGLVSKDLSTWRFVDFFDRDRIFDRGRLEWQAGTVTLLYFFHRMFLEKYILNEKWHVTLSKHREVITKRGNRLTFSNCTTILHGIVKGKSKVRERDKIDCVLKKLKFFRDEYASKH